MANPEEVDSPNAWERGVILAVLAMDAAETIGAHFDGMRGEKCSRAWQVLRQMDEKVRETLLKGWKTEASSALPAGIERLHPSWIEAALAGEPAHLVRALCSALPPALVGRLEATAGVVDVGIHGAAEKRESFEAARHDLLRVALGHLWPLCEGQAGPLAERLISMEFEELLTEIARLGARAIGRSLAGQSASVRARIMAATGEPWAAVIAEASIEKVTSAEKKAAQMTASAAMPAAVRTPLDRLLHIGLAALKPELLAEHPNSPARVAGRLPVGLGRAWLT